VEGPLTYLGMQVPGFPNLFLVNGPGSTGVFANMIMHAEMQIDWLLELIVRSGSEGVSQIDVRQDAAEKWTAHLQKLAGETIFVRANSWYVGANIEGKPRTFMLYVAGLGNYMQICREVAAGGYEGFVLSAR